MTRNQHINKLGMTRGAEKSVLIMVIVILGIVLFFRERERAWMEMVRKMNPVIDIYAEEQPTTLTVDQMVDKYAYRYGKTPGKINRTKVMLHFLLYREAGYGKNQTCGDSGKACGPMQFHESTWQRMRKQMLKAKLIDEVGSRWNLEQAIETTAWAINNGREREWGPILRGEIKI